MTEKILKQNFTLANFLPDKIFMMKTLWAKHLQDLKHCAELAESATMNAKVLLVIFLLSIGVTTLEGIGFTVNS